ncbi:MAG TPA: DUF6527 family protein [Bacteroidia bacterium]|nr:DUF6527 family protein [Bacteroidia bacterium]
MNRLTEITPKYLDEIPKELEEGVLYISEKYWVAIHLCACGCKDKSVTPLKTIGDSIGWTLTKINDKVTLNPSIGNWSSEKNIGYHAHYFIIENKINWC